MAVALGGGVSSGELVAGETQGCSKSVTDGGAASR